MWLYLAAILAVAILGKLVSSMIAARMNGLPWRESAALGVLLNTPEAVYMGPNPRAFGHHGIGGSIGFADPDAKIGFSYAVNKMHAVGDNGPRARRLIDALYSVVG